MKHTEKYSDLLKMMTTLDSFQMRKLETYVVDMSNLNEQDKNLKPDRCPYCEQEAPMIKKGFSCGKQRFQCKHCGHVFTYDPHTITMYSKIERSKFCQIVLDTLNGVPVKATAASLDLSIPCVFENRHKILCAMEKLLENDPSMLCGTIEIDETFELESQKGNRNIKRKARKRGEPSKFRGISHEQVCIVTTTDRNGHEIFKAVGSGKPTSNIILENFAEKLVEKSIIYSDGITCYDLLAKVKDCRLVQLKDVMPITKQSISIQSMIFTQ